MLVKTYLFALPAFKSLVPMCKAIPSVKHLGEKALRWQVKKGPRSAPALVPLLLWYEDVNDRMPWSWCLSRETVRTHRVGTSLEVAWS